MANDFYLSIAQKYMLFITSFVKVTVAGDNYSKVMMFVGESDVATYFVGAESVGACIQVSYFDYATYVKGKLLTWLTDFFDANQVSTIYLVVWDDGGGTFSTTGLTTQYDAYDTLAFFKMAIASTHAHQQAIDLAGATLATADTLLSQWWVNSSDASILTATVGNDAAALIAAGKDTRVIFHYDGTRGPALLQLGLSLATLNSTQTAVGNSLDYVQTSLITPSLTPGQNLDSVSAGNCQTQHVGFFTTLGDSSGQVALEGPNGAGLTTLGNEPAAKWVSNYVDFVSSVYSAQFMTQINTFRNNASYQGVLSILVNQLQKFAAFGRLANLQITAPKFSDLTVTADSFTVPNAWVATFVGNARKCTVNGTLYIPA